MLPVLAAFVAVGIALDKAWHTGSFVWLLGAFLMFSVGVWTILIEGEIVRRDR